MEHNPFRPHWTHKLCSGVVSGLGDVYKCLKCNTAAKAVGAVLPTGVTNSREYFASHPDLEVDLVNGDTDVNANGTPEHGFRSRALAPMRMLSRWRERLR